MLQKGVFTLLTLALLAGKAWSQAAPTQFVRYVNPFIGTGPVDKNSLSGNTFPGATTPFGLVQLSPDTSPNPGMPCGYDYNDKTIVGFSHTHLNGTGIPDLFDVLLMPTTGAIKTTAGQTEQPGSGYRSQFSHQQESARPGYYQVKLLDYNINAELTATEHAGLHRYTFPASEQAHIVMDLDHSLDKKINWLPTKILDAQIRVVDNHTVEGFRIITGWAPVRKVYFRAEFSQPFTSHVLVNGSHSYANLPLINTGSGPALKGVFNFTTTAQKPVLVKVGLSSVSPEGARQNLQAELPGWDFDQTARQAEAQWEKELQAIAVEGTDAQKQMFYTGLYHAFIQPNNLADVNGDYLATDLTVHNAPDKTHYSTFSLWDTYRAAHPLYTLIQPARTAGFIRTMMRQYDTYGHLPIWQLWGEENYCMIGNHAIPVLVDAALKGLPDVDANKVYEAVKGSSVTDHPGSPFAVWEQYGFLPEDLQSQSVSITLEMAYNDWCVAQLARKLGKTADYEHFSKRAAFYKNLYDAKTGFFRAKNKDGQWLAPFDPLAYGGNGGSPYTEANAWQYFWYVPEDVTGLIGLVGGPKAFTAKLDEFFTLKDKPGAVNGNASGFIGQYAHGNEPSHHIAYLYDFAGQPWKTQQYVSHILNTLYDTSSAGYSGNEDCGQMSAWYIFSAMGFYPVNPANGVYALGSPVLQKAVLHLAQGKTFTVTARNPSKANCYIQSVKLNGKPYNKAYITQNDLMTGGTLAFVMGPKPNLKWATQDGSAPLAWGY